MTIDRIVVDINTLNRSLEAFKIKHKHLRVFMQDTDFVMKQLGSVTWMSDASKSLMTQYQLIYDQVMEATMIVEEYIVDLETASREYASVEQTIESRVEGLGSTNVFGV